MNIKAIREIKMKLTLTSCQQEIIVDTLLGDGHLETQI